VFLSNFWLFGAITQAAPIESDICEQGAEKCGNVRKAGRMQSECGQHYMLFAEHQNCSAY